MLSVPECATLKYATFGICIIWAKGQGALTVRKNSQVSKSSPVVKEFLFISNVKESSCNAGDLGSIPGSGRFLRKGHGYPLQYSCLDKSLVGYCPWGWKELHMIEWLTLLLFKNIFIKETHICQDVSSYAKKRKILNNSNVVKTLISVCVMDLNIQPLFSILFLITLA